MAFNPFSWLLFWRKPEQSDSPHIKGKSSIYRPLPKYYMFNETGNIMLCTSEKNIQGFDEDIRNSFIDVTVFFAAMSKAIHTTINPLTEKPYTIYNYQAVKNILLSSGMFVEVNVEEGTFHSERTGESMGKDFLQHTLNRNFEDVNLPFSRAMFNGMRYQQNMKAAPGKEGHLKDGQAYFRGGSLFFICEILMGIPQTTAVLLRIEPESIEDEASKAKAQKKALAPHCNIYELGSEAENQRPCRHFKRSWKYKKRTFLFVPPKFLSNNSASLARGESAELESLVEKFRESLTEDTSTEQTSEE